jgi:hypothetical protein
LHGIILRGRIAAEGFKSGIKNIDSPVHGTHPDPSIHILVKGQDKVIGQGKRIALPVIEGPELHPIVPVQTLMGADPHESMPVPQKTGYFVGRKPVLD